MPRSDERRGHDRGRAPAAYGDYDDDDDPSPEDGWSIPIHKDHSDSGAWDHYEHADVTTYEDFIFFW